MQKVGTDRSKTERMKPGRTAAVDAVQFRLTPQRMMILRLLKADPSHPRAEDIYRKAREKGDSGS
jgi:Fe2+ or Zn2+ uptake regulation protein